jgi:hypothetical protein
MHQQVSSQLILNAYTSYLQDGNGKRTIGHEETPKILNSDTQEALIRQQVRLYNQKKGESKRRRVLDASLKIIE